jgi:hypothetical protein
MFDIIEVDINQRLHVCKLSICHSSQRHLRRSPTRKTKESTNHSTKVNLFIQVERHIARLSETFMQINDSNLDL